MSRPGFAWLLLSMGCSVAPAAPAAVTAGAAPDPEMAPAPFTVDELRAGNRRGHIVMERIVDHGSTTYAVAHFVAADDQGAMLEVRALDESQQPLGEPQRVRVTWEDLRSHGLFPANATTIEEGVVELAGATLEAEVYEVRTTTPEGPSVRKLWFATDRPGGPMRSEVRIGDAVVTTSEVVEWRDRMPAGIVETSKGCLGTEGLDCAQVHRLWAVVNRVADVVEASDGTCGIEGLKGGEAIYVEEGPIRVYAREPVGMPSCEFVVQLRDGDRIVERGGMTDPDGWVQLAAGWYVGPAVDEPPPQHVGAKRWDAAWLPASGAGSTDTGSGASEEGRKVASVAACRDYLGLYERCESRLEPEIMAGDRRFFRAEKASLEFHAKTLDAPALEQMCGQLLTELRPHCEGL